MDKMELYDRLMRYMLPLGQLEAYSYPVRDPNNPQLRKVPAGKYGQKQQLREKFADSYTCGRCSKVYCVDQNGMPSSTSGSCSYLYAGRLNSNPYHVHRGEQELENYRGYVETRPKVEWDPNRHGLYALDCEMCYTNYGLELTKITVVDHKYEVVYERLVRPTNPILDYNTKFSGLRQGDLDDVQTTLADVQRHLLELFSSKTILIGHGLDSDMKALKLFHKCFIDTAQLFPHKRGLPYKRALRTLMDEKLGVIIQRDVSHDSKEDASAAFRLVMWKANIIL